MKTLIQNATILAEDGVLPHGYLLIDGARIASLGTTPPKHDGMRVIDARGGIVMPGLVNCHTHIPMTLFRGYGDDMLLHDWLENRIWPAEDKLTGEAAYWGALLSFAEMLKSGTTAFADMYFFSEDIVRALIESGMKGNVARTVTGLGETDFKQPLAEAVTLHRAYDGAEDGRIRIDHALHAVYTCGESCIRAVAETAQRDGAVLQIHISETQKENADCQAQYGISPTALLARCGAFAGKVNAAHCVWVSEEDMDILAANDVGVAHNPTSNLKLASGIAPVARMLEKGITVGLGTDGAASNNCLELFGEMKLAAILQKGATLDPTVVPAADALRMATAGGARILGRDDAGTLRPGARADVVLLDADAPCLAPTHDALSNAVYAANAGCVRSVFVDGRPLLDEGTLTTLDLEKIRFHIDQIAPNF